MKFQFDKLYFILVGLLILFFPITSIGQLYESKELDSLKQLLRTENLDANENIELSVEIAKAYRNSNIDSLLFYATIAHSLSMKAGNTKGLAHATFYKAAYYDKIGDFDKSLELFAKTIELYKKTPKDINYFNAVNLMGIIYERRHDYDMALECYMIGLQNAQSLNYRLDEAFFYNNISIIYGFIGSAKNELEYIKKASVLFKELGEDYYYSYTLVNIGGYYMTLGDIDSALFYLIKAKPLLINDNNYYGLTNLYSNLGSIYYDLGQDENALANYELSLQNAELIDISDSDRPNRMANANLYLAWYYLQKKKYTKALYHYRKVKTLAAEVESLYQLKEVSMGLFKIFLKLNNSDSALYYHDLSIKYNDSLYAETYNDKIDQLNYEFQLEKEKELFEKDKALIISENNRQELVYITIAGLLLLIVFIVIIVWYLQKLRLQASELKSRNLRLENENISAELERKNRELTTTVLNLLERNEFILKISDQLKKSSILDNENSKSVEKIIKSIDKDTVNSLWKEFEVRYMEVHKAFHQKLTSRYPDLTANERRLCAFIVLNLSIKDISSITYQSPQSIKMARYRLRRKLGIGKNENLTAFLHNL